ncbi:MAG: DUF4230 domain-containing protein [Lachnospiraceae bacterium]|nr:DUF4230 domain-containing protein [Lachnospiraceae bacterium]MBO6300618.1 DUF4230 domain-containing protein [Lachnospiraceae bacterium]MBP3295212.1 DUF4230 domain-containing protein [Lachnospiraceae bacterium]
MDNNKKTIIVEEKQRIGKGMIIGIVLTLLVLVVVGILIRRWLKDDAGSDAGEAVGQVVEQALEGEEGEVYTDTIVELKRIITEGQLYTIEYPYNGYTTVYKDGGDKAAYYVAYKGSVKAGIDVQNIEVSVDEDTKTVTVHLPHAQISQPVVDISSLEFIYVDEKFRNDETGAAEAYNAAVEDIAAKTEGNALILDMAEQNAVMIEKAFVESWINISDNAKEYTVNVVIDGDR